MSLLTVEKLTLRYPRGKAVLDGLDLRMARGDTLALVGESGSGKTQTALAIMGLLPATAAVSGSVRFDGTELSGADEQTLNRYRARRIAMVFQDPLQALNPYLRVGEQLGRVLAEHGLATGRAARARVVDMLRQVELPDPVEQARAYPHELSGGMRQRVMIAAALLCEPDLLIADEPTTALDVTVQAQILELLRTMQERYGTALMLITHDLAVVAGNCERMLVLDGGRAAEEGPTARLFVEPAHPRTRALLAQASRLDDIAFPEPPEPRAPLLSADAVGVSYFRRPYGATWRRVEVRAVRDASFELRPGETLALVGESGSGKTSLVRALFGLLPLAAGEASFCGASLAAEAGQRPRTLRRELALVFQDPVGSLNPAMRVAAIVGEPLAVHRQGLAAAERDAAVAAMIARVGLDPGLMARLPHQLSGGQAQRVALARALIVQPKLLVLDEAVAALDGGVRAEILALLAEEQRSRGLSLLVISHDLAVVRSISHRLLVMYLGRLCESGDSASVFARPRHPYTRALIDSVPVPDPGEPRRAPLRGEVSSLLAPPPGCPFHPRCAYAIDRCRSELPAPQRFAHGEAACHRAAELDLGTAGSGES